ncbi:MULTISPECIES: sigma-70 family RNA polymerase sigma factor [unclassified Leptolyngbya]|uniref:sigma-70 family RNA polymerase sigma factor n=1 Tax=unclassified Leptolyngbya TaxID=2650499 RepID=UPI00168633A4|nr:MULTISPECIES: sigma-70 family RNA polymerase sigma factor [unclassified Leptolyngbya]MBD1909336.1 sigma-70 family RNA polymerase sigma factor [Leptolyngbya sp. FACHB-8]MBD2158194.1 sigma-70 family RNA polymerase sigma factor [Leptolyngbya sp. FACHB-16]
MQARQDVMDQFTTFLQFAGDRAEGWAVDGRLRRSMQMRMAELDHQTSSEAFWAVYWHHQWLATETTSSQQLSLAHLSAYLQEVGYWAAQRVAQTGNPLFDGFQIALEKLPKVLRACDPNHHVSLKPYSRIAFENIIRDSLRQQQTVNLCNDWALLLRVSRKRIQEALQQVGLSAETIARYVLACQSYEAGYQLLRSANRQRIQRPDAEDWETLVQCYNQRRSPQDPTIDAATMETWLLYCAKQVRTYLYPTFLSLNAPRSEDESDWQSELPAQQEPPLTMLMEQEDTRVRQEQRSQLNEILSAALGQLDSQSQHLLQTYYQQQLTQQQIAQQLDLPQYTVSRRLSKAREKLLIAVVRWSQSTLHIEPSSTVMNSISALLEDWLYHHLPTADSPTVPTHR